MQAISYVVNTSIAFSVSKPSKAFFLQILNPPWYNALRHKYDYVALLLINLTSQGTLLPIYYTYTSTVKVLILKNPFWIRATITLFYNDSLNRPFDK